MYSGQGEGPPLWKSVHDLSLRWVVKDGRTLGLHSGHPPLKPGR